MPNGGRLRSLLNAADFKPGFARAQSCRANPIAEMVGSRNWR